MRGQGEVVQDVVTTFSSEVLANDSADHEGEIPCHRDRLLGSHTSIDLSITVAPAGESNMFASDVEVDEEVGIDEDVEVDEER
jgi:hypothetical protein